MKAIDFISGTVMEYIPQLTKENLMLKYDITLNYQKKKRYLEKVTHQMALKKFCSNFVLKLRQ